MKKAVKKSMAKKRASIASRTTTLLKTGKRKLGDLRPVWERAKQRLEETAEAAGRGGEKAVEKTVAMTTLASVKFKIRRQKQDLQYMLADLGGWVYELAKRNPQALSPTDAEIIDMIGRIAEKEKEIADLEEKAKSLAK
jgi:hypothetical protein